MSTILAIETSTIAVSVALVGSDALIGSTTVRGTRLQAETLHPAIEELCRRADVTLADLDAIAVDIGPGRFTGLRVGVACAKALGFALDLGVVPLRSTEVLLKGAELYQGPVVPVVDLRRGEVAFVLPGGGPTPELGTPEVLVARLVAAGTRDPLLVGDGAIRHGSAIEEAWARPVRFGGDEHAAPRAEVLGRMGLDEFDLEKAIDPFELTPLYLRGVDVRIGWETRDGLATALLAGKGEPA